MHTYDVRPSTIRNWGNNDTAAGGAFRTRMYTVGRGE